MEAVKTICATWAIINDRCVCDREDHHTIIIPKQPKHVLIVHELSRLRKRCVNKLFKKMARKKLAPKISEAWPLWLSSQVKIKIGLDKTIRGSGNSWQLPSVNQASKMPLICENVPAGDLTRKAEYMWMSDFIRIRHTRRPNIPIADKWCLRSYFMPAKYRQSAQVIENFHVRPDDVWVVTFPKCGTTWTQEMVWQICNDLDFEQGKAVGLGKRFPFLELGTIVSDKFKMDFLPVVDKMESPRLIKSHLPAPLLPKDIWTVKPKIIYVARNAKDSAVSFYHHYKNLQGYRGSFDDFLDIFLKDYIIYAPYDSHIIDFWNMRNEENILFITYEDMKSDHPKVIKQVADFLEKPLTDEQIHALADHLTFDKMSKNGSVNFEDEMKHFEKLMNNKKDQDYNFIRKGKVGSYREEMSTERIEMFDTWIQERLTKYNFDPQLLEIFTPSK